MGRGFESFERRQADQLEDEGLKNYGLKAEGAEAKANAEFGDKNQQLKTLEQKSQEANEKKNEFKEDSENAHNSIDALKGFETSIKSGIEKAREAEKNDPENKPPIEGGETQANNNLNAGINMAWP